MQDVKKRVKFTFFLLLSHLAVKSSSWVAKTIFTNFAEILGGPIMKFSEENLDEDT